MAVCTTGIPMICQFQSVLTNPTAVFQSVLMALATVLKTPQMAFPMPWRKPTDSRLLSGALYICRNLAMQFARWAGGRLLQAAIMLA